MQLVNRWCMIKNLFNVLFSIQFLAVFGSCSSVLILIDSLKYLNNINSFMIQILILFVFLTFIFSLIIFFYSVVKIKSLLVFKSDRKVINCIISFFIIYTYITKIFPNKDILDLFQDEAYITGSLLFSDILISSIINFILTLMSFIFSIFLYRFVANKRIYYEGFLFAFFNLNAGLKTSFVFETTDSNKNVMYSENHVIVLGTLVSFNQLSEFENLFNKKIKDFNMDELLIVKMQCI